MNWITKSQIEALKKLEKDTYKIGGAIEENGYIYYSVNPYVAYKIPKILFHLNLNIFNERALDLLWGEETTRLKCYFKGRIVEQEDINTKANELVRLIDSDGNNHYISYKFFKDFEKLNLNVYAVSSKANSNIVLTDGVNEILIAPVLVPKKEVD